MDALDKAPDHRAQAAALQAGLSRREHIVGLIRSARRPDGVTRLSDVAICCRVRAAGYPCRPSDVAALRAELLEAGEDVAAPVCPPLNEPGVSA